jgi:hypothetical protein
MSQEREAVQSPLDPPLFERVDEPVLRFNDLALLVFRVDLEGGPTAPA